MEERKSSKLLVAGSSPAEGTKYERLYNWKDTMRDGGRCSYNTLVAQLDSAIDYESIG